MTKVLPGALVLLALLTQSAPAPTPDFSGTWVAISPSEAIGQRLSVMQGPTTLQIQVTTKDGGYTTRYHFDDKLRVTARDEEVHAATRSSARWEDGKLVLLDIAYPPGRRVLRAMSLDRDGQLVLELRSHNQGDDPEQNAGNILEKRRAVFKRAK